MHFKFINYKILQFFASALKPTINLDKPHIPKIKIDDAAHIHINTLKPPGPSTCITINAPTRNTDTKKTTIEISIRPPWKQKGYTFRSVTHRFVCSCAGRESFRNPDPGFRYGRTILSATGLSAGLHGIVCPQRDCSRIDSLIRSLTSFCWW